MQAAPVLSDLCIALCHMTNMYLHVCNAISVQYELCQAATIRDHGDDTTGQHQHLH